MKTLPENILKCLSKEQREPLGKGFKTSAEANAKFEAKNEREIQKHIANYLRLKGIWFAQSRTDKKTTTALGQPDFIASCWLMSGNKLIPRPIAFEVKYQNGKLSDIQEKVKNHMELCGWEVFVVRSLQEVIEILKV